MKHTRRDLIGALLGGAAAIGAAGAVFADPGAQLPESSRGGSRTGPLGPSDAVQTLASERPTAMIIPEAEVDAEVEVNYIIDGQMKDPTGAWVIAWYEGTGLLHEKKKNMLYSGHVDYWGVGPSVLRNVARLPEGAEITVLGDKGGQAVYTVEYIERVTLANMTPEKMHEITAPTPYEALTIITCGGEFDYNAGEYLQRDIIRARLVEGGEQGQALGNRSSAPQELEGTPNVNENAVHRSQATVMQDGVNVRPTAGTDGSPVARVNAGDVLTLTGEPEEADGYTWYPVRLEDGTEGFVAADYLQTAP